MMKVTLTAICTMQTHLLHLDRQKSFRHIVQKSRKGRVAQAAPMLIFSKATSGSQTAIVDAKAFCQADSAVPFED